MRKWLEVRMRKNFSWSMSTATTVPTTVFQPRYQFIQVWSGWSGRSCQSTSQSSHILCDGGKGRLSAEAPVSKHQLSKFSKVSWSSNHWHPLATTGIHWHPLASTAFKLEVKVWLEASGLWWIPEVIARILAGSCPSPPKMDQTSTLLWLVDICPQ